MVARKDWISSVSWQLIQDKRQARLHAEFEKIYKRLQKECRAALRRDRQRWADEMAEEAETALQRGQLKDIVCIRQLSPAALGGAPALESYFGHWWTPARQQG